MLRTVNFANGDSLLIRLDTRFSPESYKKAKEFFEKLFSNNKIVLLDNSVLDIAVLSDNAKGSYGGE
jgi:hypothetical protein